MTVTTRQLNHLKEMGISLWQRKDLENSTVISKENNDVKDLIKNITSEVSADVITSQQIFQDILRALSIQSDDVSWQKTHLELGGFNWQFIENTTVKYEESMLKTPSIEKISQSNTLKKQLWQIILQNNLSS